MDRIKLHLTDSYTFATELPIRLSDLNYGGHVGNDTVLSLVQEARQQFLAKYGYKELDFAGTGLIMADAVVEYKRELNYGDLVNISVAAVNFDRLGFDMHFLLQISVEGILKVAGKVKTGMLCYDYNLKKKVPVPAEALSKFQTAL